MAYYGTKEWVCPNKPKLFTTIDYGRRFLYLNGKQIAMQMRADARPAAWVRRKCEERFQSTSKHYEKTEKLLAQIGKENGMWCDLCNMFDEMGCK